MSEERLIELETRVAFQEKTIKELSDVLYAQQQEMNGLKDICVQLRSQITAFSEAENGPDPREERPPHY